MSEHKFACPSCGQHLSCEETLAGARIDCPACFGVIVVPTPAPSNPSGLTLAKMASRPRRLYPVPADTKPWTEEEWNQHVAEIEGPYWAPFEYMDDLGPFDLILSLFLGFSPFKIAGPRNLSLWGWILFYLACIGGFALVMSILFAGCLAMSRW